MAEGKLPIVASPPLYPPLEFKPRPLPTGKKEKYLFNLKQEMVSWTRRSSFYIAPITTKKDIERYSDRHKPQILHEIEWDESLFPRELFHNEIIPPMEGNKESDDVTDHMEKLKVWEVLESGLQDRNEDHYVNTSFSSEEQSHYGYDGHFTDEEESMDLKIEDEESDYVKSYFDNGEDYPDSE